MSEHIRSQNARAMHQNGHQQTSSASRSPTSETTRLRDVYGRNTSDYSAHVTREGNECWSGPTQFPVSSIDLDDACVRDLPGQGATQRAYYKTSNTESTEDRERLGNISFHGRHQQLPGRARGGGGVQNHARRPRPVIVIFQFWKPMARMTGPFEATIQEIKQMAAQRRVEVGAAPTFRSLHFHGIHFFYSAASYALQAANNSFTTCEIRPNQSINRRAKSFSDYARDVSSGRYPAELFASRRTLGQV